MNDTIGQLSPPCQAVLHGSWASSLFALDSSLDITILEKGFRMPEGKGYHNTAFKDLVPGVSTYIKSQLNQVLLSGLLAPQFGTQFHLLVNAAHRSQIEDVRNTGSIAGACIQQH